MPENTKYEFGCGCIHTQYLKIYKKNVCIKHPDQKIVKKYRKCSKCGVWVESNLKASSKIYFCIPCRPWAKYRAMKTQQKKRKRERIENPYRKEYVKKKLPPDPIAFMKNRIPEFKIPIALSNIFEKTKVSK